MLTFAPMVCTEAAGDRAPGEEGAARGEAPRCPDHRGGDAGSPTIWLWCAPAGLGRVGPHYLRRMAEWLNPESLDSLQRTLPSLPRNSHDPTRQCLPGRVRNSASPWPTVGLNAAVGGASGAMHDVLAERGERLAHLHAMRLPATCSARH